MKKYKNCLLFLIPIIILSIILLAFWPGIYTYDGNYQWNQVVTNNITTAHPFLSTFVLLLLSKIWNSNTILFFLQIIVFSIIWGKISNEMLKENKQIKLIIIYSIILCLVPIISIYTITAWKDVLYSYFLLAIIHLLYLGSKNSYQYNKIQYVLLGLLLFLVFSYRHNGIIVAILLFILLMVLIIKTKDKENIKKSFIMLVTFIISFIAISFPKSYYLSKSKVETEKASLGTLDAYAAWMMGAHLNKDYVTEEDMEFLNNFIEINEWKKAYSPFLVNATNLASTRDNQYILDNLDEFRKIFVKYSLKHPLTIVEHYMKSDALLWSPFPIGYVYQYDFKLWGPDYGFEVRNTSKLPLLNKIYEKGITITMRKPIRVIMYQPATIMYISILLTFILVKSLKNKKLWIILTPMLANIISLLPINLAQDLRYVYINYLTLGFVGLLVVVNYKEIFIYLKNLFKIRKTKRA